MIKIQIMLKFGTSGLRGLVTELTDKECYLYTTAFLEYLADKKLVEKNGKIAIAGDLRPSTERILVSCLESINGFGCKPDYCGVIPTPAVSLYGFSRLIPSVMVTGSHIPYDRNGIKFNLPDGEILKEDEQAITEIYSKISSSGKFDALFNADGKFKKKTEDLPAPYKNAVDEYVNRYLDFFKPGLLTGKKIVVYQHSAVGRDIMVEILNQLGADTIAVGRSEEFIPIDTESIQEEVLKMATDWAQKFQPDAIISADGDSDRPVLFDENGNFIRGDILGIVCAEYLEADSVTATISCNTALEKCGKFKKINRTKIGSPYVIEGMNVDKKTGMRAVSYEANGGFLTANDIEINGRLLKALPTRDAMLPILAAVSLSIKKDLLLSELIKTYPQRYVWTETVKNFPTETSKEIIGKISGGDEKTKADAKKLFDLPADVEKIDYTDGARMLLTNGEFVHLRPSGNAPELRIYLEAATPQRAKELAEKVLEKVAELKN